MKSRSLGSRFHGDDLPGLGIAVPAVTMRRFWTMLAHRHGQIWNGSEFARAFGMSDHTVKRYLDVHDGAFMARVLAPWHENLSKRQVRAPKVYVRDRGLLLTLLGVAGREALLGHPKVGAAWLIVRVQPRLGFEFKHTATPARTSCPVRARDPSASG